MHTFSFWLKFQREYVILLSEIIDGGVKVKKAELNQKFNAFYERTYRSAMVYCLAKTGDFLNCEDLLTDAYLAVYKKFIKSSKEPLKDPERVLSSVLKSSVAKYWEKHRKDLKLSVPEEKRTDYETLLQTELELTEEQVVRKMLQEDIVEFVSTQPVPMRRAFALCFYLDRSIEETAAELKVSTSEVCRYLYGLLQEIRENFLEEFEG